MYLQVMKGTKRNHKKYPLTGEKGVNIYVAILVNPMSLFNGFKLSKMFHNAEIERLPCAFPPLTKFPCLIHSSVWWGQPPESYLHHRWPLHPSKPSISKKCIYVDECGIYFNTRDPRASSVAWVTVVCCFCNVYSSAL